jgi:hypothetical protein
VQRNIDTQRKCNDQDNCGEHPVYIYKQINHRMYKDIVFERCISRKGRVAKKVSFSSHYTIAPSCSVMRPFVTLGIHNPRPVAPATGCNPSFIHHHSCAHLLRIFCSSGRGLRALPKNNAHKELRAILYVGTEFPTCGPYKCVTHLPPHLSRVLRKEAYFFQPGFPSIAMKAAVRSKRGSWAPLYRILRPQPRS